MPVIRPDFAWPRGEKRRRWRVVETETRPPLIVYDGGFPQPWERPYEPLRERDLYLKLAAIGKLALTVGAERAKCVTPVRVLTDATMRGGWTRRDGQLDAEEADQTEADAVASEGEFRAAAESEALAVLGRMRQLERVDMRRRSLRRNDYRLWTEPGDVRRIREEWTLPPDSILRLYAAHAPEVQNAVSRFVRRWGPLSYLTTDKWRGWPVEDFLQEAAEMHEAVQLAKSLADPEERPKALPRLRALVDRHLEGAHPTIDEKGDQFVQGRSCRDLLQALWLQLYTRVVTGEESIRVGTCEECGAQFNLRRAGQRFCGGACKVREWLRRHPKGGEDEQRN